MIHIKKATISDVKILALLARITYSESHEAFINNTEDLIKYNNDAFSIEKISETLNDENTCYFIAEVNDFPVGYAKLILNAENKNIEDKNSCRLERIYVLNEFLGQKIGYKLYETVINEAKNLSFHNIWLTTYIKNTTAINFYTKLNFKNVGDFTFYVNGKPFENFVFSKKLT